MVTREELEVLHRDGRNSLDLFNQNLQIKMTSKDFGGLISKLYLRLSNINRFEMKFIKMMLLSKHTPLRCLAILCSLLGQHKQNA